MKRRLRQLSSRILLSVLAIVLASSAVGFALTVLHARAQLRHDSQLRALSIAQAFAAMPSVRSGLERRSPADRRLIRALAQQVSRETGATYIVVLDRSGIRYSHPDPALIGKRVRERVVALDGRNHLGIDHGNLGVSANAKTPIWAPGGRRIIGEVSAGILMRRISDQFVAELPALLLYFACALGIGTAASLTLARRLKRSTFGLELDEIAALVREREAVLHSIREGVIVLDHSGRITLINDEARRLTQLGAEDFVGRHLQDLVPAGRLRDLLSGEVSGRDEVVLSDEHVLVVNRQAVSRDGRELGAVITLRDRTELEGLLRELDNVDALSNALRAQQHEFSNRLHTLAGLIELGDHDQAVAYALEASHTSDARAEAIAQRIERRELAAMLVAKTTIAAERSIELVLSEDSSLPDTGELTSPLLTIVGNLINNALDAAAAGEPPARVVVRLVERDGDVELIVTDSGPGVPPGMEETIFTDGFTTKADVGHRNQGLGLALVHRLVHQAGGTIEVGREPTTFRVTLPRRGVSEIGLARKPVGAATARTNPSVTGGRE